MAVGCAINEGRGCWTSWTPGTRRWSRIDSLGQLLLLTCLAKRVSPPPRGPRSARTRAVPSVAFSSTASSVHHARPSCTPTWSRPELAQREHHHALHGATLHIVARHVVTLHSYSSFLVVGPALAPVLPNRFRARPNHVRSWPAS
jgi:hypothetical protein